MMTRDHMLPPLAAFCLWLVLFGGFAASPALAETYWLNPTAVGAPTICSQVAGSSDPGVYMTPTAFNALNCQEPGDTVIWKAGTYTEVTNWDTLLINGTAGLPITYRCEGDQTCILRPTARNSNQSAIIHGLNKQYMNLGTPGHGFDIDGTSIPSPSTNLFMGIYLTCNNSADKVGVNLYGHHIHRYSSNGFSLARCNTQSGHTYVDGVIEGITVDDKGTPYAGNQDAQHPLYNQTKRYIIRKNDFTVVPNIATVSSFGVHCYPSNICQDNIIDDNIIRGTLARGGGILVAGPRNVITNNRIRNTGATTAAGITFFGSLADNNSAFHNLIHGYTTQLLNGSGATGNQYRNNICITGFGCGANLNSGTVLGWNSPDVAPGQNLTGVATSHFVNHASLNYTLVSGSTLIDNATCLAIAGRPFNGVRPDCGPYESFTHSSATINEAFLDVTLGVNDPREVPLVITAAGWSAACTVGANCGTPVVAAASLLSGSSNVARLTISGITGGVSEGDQTWTVSYNSATGASLNARGQELSSFTTQPVTNNSGTPPDPQPGTAIISYDFDEGAGTTLTDGEGGDHNGTLSGTTAWGTGLSGTGLTLTDGVSGGAAVPYGNGENPSTQSISVAFWVNIPANLTSATRTYFGHAGVSSNRFYISTLTGTWRIGIQGSNDGTASNLSVASGWNRLCLVANSGTDIATLTVNNVTGTTGASKAYTSYALPSDLTIGTPFGASSNPGVTYDDFRLLEEVIDCADDWASAQPPSPPSTGNREQVASQFVGALFVDGDIIPMAAVNTDAKVAATGLFGWKRQVDCTVAACSSMAEKVYYSCALCPSAGEIQPLTDTLGPDQIAYAGTQPQHGISGAVTGLLSGALTPIDGSVLYTEAGVPVLEQAQNSSLTHISVMQIGPDAEPGWEYCFYVRNQTGVELDDYTAAAIGCMEVARPSASGFASLPDQPTGLTVTPNPTWAPLLSHGRQVGVMRSSWSVY